MFEEDDTLAAEATSEEDKDRSRLERFSWFGGLDRFANLKE